MSLTLFADIILILHFLFVLFIVIGLILIWTGKFRKWKWVKNFWFRTIHMVAMVFVAVITMLDIPCPLTIWEGDLRISSGASFYDQGFIQYWLHKIIFYQLPGVMFTTVYILFTIAIAGSLYFIPPDIPSYFKKRKVKL